MQDQDKLGEYTHTVDVINLVAEDCAQIAEDHGFHDVLFEQYEAATITALALIASEVFEALEVFRKRNSNEDGSPRDIATDMTLSQTARFIDELADIVIRTFDLAKKNHYDIGGAILRKMDKNRGRPYLHGRAF